MKKLISLLIIISNSVFSFEFYPNGVDLPPKVNGSISIGDLNNDGYKDIFVGELYYYRLDGGNSATSDSEAQVFINNKNGQFLKTQFPMDFGETHIEVQIRVIGNPPVSIIETQYYRSTIADVDNDGFNDIIMSDGRIFLNDNFTRFEEISDTGIGSTNKQVFALDFDNDGVLEIFNRGRINKRVSLSPLSYSSQGSLNFGEHNSIEFNDMNSDSYLDVIDYSSTNRITIYLNDGQGNFSLNNLVQLDDSEDYKLLIADVDNNGWADIVLSDGSIYFNSEGMQFNKMMERLEFDGSVYNDYTNYHPISIVNYNNDDYPDILITTWDTNSNNYPYYQGKNYVLINNKEGQFAPAENAISSYIGGHFGIAIADDFNNDGFDDFIVNIDGGVAETIDEAGINRIYNPITLDLYLHLQLTNPEIPVIYSSPDTSLVFSEFIPFDINNDGKNEYIANKYTSILTMEYRGSGPYVWDSAHHIIKNITHNGYEVDTLSLFENETIYPRLYSRGDFNNDGLQDLFVFRFGDSTRIFYNSQQGLSENNYQDLESYWRPPNDVNGDGLNELIKFDSQGMRVFSYREDGEYGDGELIAVDNSDFLNSNYKRIQDFDLDGIADYLYLNSEDKPIIVWGSGEPYTFTNEIVLFDSPISRTIYTSQIELKDYDNDGDTDVLIQTNGSDGYRYLRNTGERQFSHDNRVYRWVDGIRLQDDRFVDFDQDGKLELIKNNGYSLSVLTLNENNVFEITHQLNPKVCQEDFFSSCFYALRFTVSDFDNDGKQDIYFAGEFFFNKDHKFSTGLYYDPQHSGHGFSIENVGEDLFYSVFYTYDENNDPTWYSDLGLFEKPQEDYWNISDTQLEFIKYYYDYQTQTYNPSAETNDKGYIAHDKCSDKYGMINLLYGFGEGNVGGIPTGNAEENGEWCSQSIVDYYDRPDNDFSGLWWAGSEDSGWGWSVSLVQRDSGVTDMVVVLYYYDGEGNPRWLIGQQSGFEAGSEISIPMNMVIGYPRSQPATDLQLIQAGTLRMALNQASQNILSAGTMSVDVTYPGPEGGSWIRNDIPIALFSTPR